MYSLKTLWKLASTPKYLLTSSKLFLLLLISSIGFVCFQLYHQFPEYLVPNERVSVYVDQSGELTVDDIGDFNFTAHRATISEGYTTAVYWVRIDPSYLTASNYLLALNYSAIRAANIYFENQQGQLQSLSSGLDIDRHQWPIISDEIIFPLKDLNVNKFIYLRLASDYAMQSTIELIPVESARITPDKILWGAFYGCLLFIFFYNVNLFFGTNEYNYFFYSIHTFFNTGAIIALSGHGFLVWPALEGFDNYSISVWVSLNWISGCLFTRHFLQLPKQLPWLNKINTTCIAIWLGFFIIAFGFQKNLSVITTPFSITTCLLLIFAGIRSTSNMFGQYFILAWGIFLTGIIAVCLGYLGIVDRNLVTTHGVELGQLVQTLILALALAARMRQLKNEKLEQAQLREKISHDLVRAVRKQYAASLESTIIKDKFLATLSHEMRTPMHGIIAPLQNLLESENDQTTMANIRLSLSSANLMKSMLDRLLKLSDIEAGRLEITKEPIDLTASVGLLASSIKSTCSKKKLHFNYIVGKNVPHHILTDGENLISVIKIFTDNAVKYTPTGRINLAILASSEKEDEKNLHLGIIVTDTGIGFDDKTASSLFSKFLQADGSPSRLYGGLGIDLAVAHNIVQKLGGEIKFSSTINRGSIFYIRIPTKECENGKIVNLSRDPKIINSHDNDYTACAPINNELTLSEHVSNNRNNNPHASNRSVLIVEDETTNQKIAKTIIEKMGIKTVIAENGEVCLNILVSGNFDLILMDCQMPVVDGYEATRRIRALNSATAKIPIVAVTANAMLGDREKTLNCGMDDYLSKPYSPAALRDMVNKWLNKTTSHHTTTPPTTVTKKIVQKGLKILLLEKDPTYQTTVTQAIKSLGATLMVANSGHQGLQLFEAENFDLVILECNMPDINGYDTAAIIRSYNGEKRNTPIIAATVATKTGDKEKCFLVGINDYLPKPYHANDLAERLNAWLGKKMAL